MRRLIDKAELYFYQDNSTKEQLIELKEDLFFTVDERQHDADLTEQGRNFRNPDEPDAFALPDLLTEFADIETNSSLSDSEKAEASSETRGILRRPNPSRIHHITQLLKAYCLYEKDVEYVVEENKVIIVDTFTGRKMAGRRWSDGLHQAVEAKEGVQIDRETQTLATITIQNYFRLYEKLAGMTGTAETEANEFHDIYGLSVNVIPTNRPVARIDSNDIIFKTRREKYNSVVDEIRKAHARTEPVLVGTASVESSEVMSRMLNGKKSRTPFSTRVPPSGSRDRSARRSSRCRHDFNQHGGRGTDIKLGEGVIDAGGLYVIGTERRRVPPNRPPAPRPLRPPR